MDFSLSMYEELCQALKFYQVVPVEQYLSSPVNPPFVILRHDVDWELNNALAMARLEQEYGIKSTYYFRYPKTFNVLIISRIRELGHEVGYHYEVLDKAKGDYQKAIKLFGAELDVFRRYFPVQTVCMHGNPLTGWDGRSLWQYYKLSDFGLMGEAFLSCDDVQIYLTDTGRNWNDNYNAKDILKGKRGNKSFRGTRDVISFLQSMSTDSIYLNCHPERWGSGLWGWGRAFVRDNLFNLGKRLLRIRGFFKN